MFLGTAASPGIAIGPAVIVRSAEIKIIRRKVENSDREVQSLFDAIEGAKRELENIRETALRDMGAEKAAIFEAPFTERK